MNISLNPEHEEFIKKQIQKGRYTSPLEVISAAFKVLEAQELQPDNLHQKKKGDQIVSDDTEENFVGFFMKISESTINEYWLNEEEDEAWKNL